LQLSSSSIQRHLAAGYHRNIALDPVDSEFMDVLDLKVVEGRGFDLESASDRINAVIVNETMAQQAGWSEPVGMEIQGLEIHPLLDSIANPVVIGVVRDYHTRPLHFPVQPVILTLNDRLNSQINKRHLLIRIAPNDVPTTLEVLNTHWQMIAPEIPFTYSFLDDDLDRQYRAEARWGKIVSYSAVFAIIIACLGLIGLVTLAVSGRAREFGIRKVLGASVSNISLLICRDYIQMTLLAVLFAIPVSYFAMNLWLQQYAYRIKLDIGLMLIPSAIAVVTGLVAISYQAVKSALANPVDSLKNE
jgi:putative ABC transport system permease protein